MAAPSPRDQDLYNLLLTMRGKEVTATECHTMSFLKELVESVYACMSGVKVMVGRHSNDPEADHLWRAAVVQSTPGSKYIPLTFQDDYGSWRLMIPFQEGNTREEALRKLLVVVEDLAAQKIEGMISRVT